jgi:HD-like signal output (HDOD) protein
MPLENTQLPRHRIIKQLLLTKPVNIPIFHEVALRLQKMMTTDEYKIEEALRLINSDPALASDMLHHANSTFNAGREKITTIKAATIRLGSQQIVNLCFTSSLASHTSKNSLINSYLKAFWKHSHLVAIASSWLAITVNYNKKIPGEIREDEIYLSGLFHDIGTLCLLKEIDLLNTSGTVCATSGLIDELLESLNLSVGVRCLEHWNLPSMYYNTIENLEGTYWIKSSDAYMIACVRTCNKLHEWLLLEEHKRTVSADSLVKQELEFLQLRDSDMIIEMIQKLSED